MKITSPEALASTLRNARKQRSLTQQTLAEQIGTKQATISTFENHPENCRIETLFKLLAALDLELQITERGQPESQTGWDQEW
ncbi:type II toxin-antitoxin system antitoxin HipB [Marinobacter persicus]|uniref:HTH-type transcriptional regulator/antitoxin HipB n=1 Tax=Marinobacter persicus TaxID=930118 RepID=A0A2S6G3P9_9GAMM|nr:type II toxin-antitoxin system antitoxin HipB [Marinobacter persicus]KXS52090.1 MAG: HTH-type transcriptional regulator, antitoxin HipB [Marinobacter sp. T13-3]PPK50428.1 HTH-type transcriptional regulator/antitoxin HipB [Marinobacter persicus]PPK53483.1 HTH-type transcriptional regulator/antitoxin HipB [Marinobacter persicus]PPK56947.1 HTH-type transcriptional regulator/antitoxin HipB [Marinobacter persicus]